MRGGWAYDLAEEILLAGAEQLAQMAFAQRVGEAAHVDERDAFGSLAHDQRGGGSQLVGGAHLGDLQAKVEQIGPAAHIHQTRQDRPDPMATPTVPMRQARPCESMISTPSRAPLAASSCCAQALRRGIRIFGQQQDPVAGVRHAGRGHSSGRCRRWRRRTPGGARR